MFKKFSENIIHQENKVLWHYWPQSFHEVWSRENNRSLNTPEPSAAVDTLYKYLGMPVINSKFLLELKNNGYLDLIDY